MIMFKLVTVIFPIWPEMPIPRSSKTGFPQQAGSRKQKEGDPQPCTTHPETNKQTTKFIMRSDIQM